MFSAFKSPPIHMHEWSSLCFQNVSDVMTKILKQNFLRTPQGLTFLHKLPFYNKVDTRNSNLSWKGHFFMHAFNWNTSFRYPKSINYFEEHFKTGYENLSEQGPINIPRTFLALIACTVTRREHYFYCFFF